MQQASKLRLLLAKISVKYDQGLPLTVAEEELLAACHHRMHLAQTETTTFDADGTMHIKHTLNAEPVMEAMKAYGDIVSGSRSRVAGAKMVGALDPITAAQWAKETGIKLHTKEFVQYVVNRLKTDRDYSKFRVGH